MQTIEAMQAIIDKSGKTSRGVSLDMGKSESYISATIAQSKRKDGGVNSATLANLADVCGYALVLLPEGEVPDGAIRVDPPEGKGRQ